MRESLLLPHFYLTSVSKYSLVILGAISSYLSFTANCWGQTIDNFGHKAKYAPYLVPVADLEVVELSPGNNSQEYGVGGDAVVIEPEIAPSWEEYQHLGILRPHTVVISDIQVRFLDQKGNIIDGHLQPSIVTREFEIQPGDMYDDNLAREGIKRLETSPLIKKATISLEPSQESGKMLMMVNVQETKELLVTPGLTLAHPSALDGVARPMTVNAMTQTPSGIAGGLRFGWMGIGGSDQILSLGLEGGENSLGFDLDFRDLRIGNNSAKIGYGVNFFNQRGIEPGFTGGDKEITLDNGDEPWVHRMGGGLELFKPFNDNFRGAWGVSYQRVSMRDDRFDSHLESEDEDGNTLIINEDGSDDLLTVNFAAILDKTNRKMSPSEGIKLLFETNQSIPMGEADILFNRLSANYTGYMPFPFLGFTQGDRTLVFNLQAGTIIGEAPPYEAFSLGGNTSVRGYGKGEIGTGRSFIQGTLEYRFPIANFTTFKRDIGLGGTFFVDYAGDLGSGDTVIGEPGEMRDKPGFGLGYGVGLRANTAFGPVRLEFAVTNEGDTAVIFNIGDRF